ncbi:MAG: pilus assembly protein PilM, partial [Pirellulaceae bacterium]|nr:pilus assembly protein PilM [Pirellulaceae bacterium]
MPKTVDAWGIEVGANALKAVHLVSNGEEIDVADYEVMPFKQILATPDIDVDEEVRVKLDEFLSRHTIAKSTVLISVPGHMAFARFAKLPPVDPKKVSDIVTFEATQQIPFPMEQVEWDYQIFMQEDSPDVEVGIFAITKDRVGQFLANYRAVGLTPDGLTLSPLAVYNAVAHEMDLGEDSPGVIIMDIGTTST